MSNEYELMETINRVNEHLESETQQFVEKMPPLKNLPTCLGLLNKKDFEFNDFINWVAGADFCKKSYDGKYQDLNKELIELYKIVKFMENRTEDDYDAYEVLYSKVTDKSEKPRHTYGQFRKSMAHTFVEYAMFRHWNERRQVYRFDKDFIAALMNTETTNLPVKILKQLPADCFYMDFRNTHFDYLTGAFVNVALDNDTGIPTVMVLCTLELPEKPGTITTSLIELTESFINDEKPVPDNEAQDTKRPGTVEKSSIDNPYNLAFFIFQAMLYLMSNRPDIQTYIGPMTKNTNMKIFDVGKRYGLLLKSAMNEDEIKYGRWHRYWTGLEKSDLIIKWIPPESI